MPKRVSLSSFERLPKTWSLIWYEYKLEILLSFILIKFSIYRLYWANLTRSSLIPYLYQLIVYNVITESAFEIRWSLFSVLLCLLGRCCQMHLGICCFCWCCCCRCPSSADNMIRVQCDMRSPIESAAICAVLRWAAARASIPCAVIIVDVLAVVVVFSHCSCLSCHIDTTHIHTHRERNARVKHTIMQTVRHLEFAGSTWVWVRLNVYRTIYHTIPCHIHGPWIFMYVMYVH